MAGNFKHPASQPAAPSQAHHAVKHADSAGLLQYSGREHEHHFCDPIRCGPRVFPVLVEPRRACNGSLDQRDNHECLMNTSRRWVG